MMQATLDSTTDAIVVTDLNGNVRDFNEKYAQMMGVTREQMDIGDASQTPLKIQSATQRSGRICLAGHGDLSNGAGRNV